MKNSDERKAVAVHYDQVHTPTVTAKGSGETADQIIRAARENKVPIFQNAELLRLLADVPPGEEIPETLYQCMAQVIAFAYSIRGKTPLGWEARKDKGAHYGKGPIGPLH